MNYDETLLIRKAQRGNIQAFDKLVSRYDAKVMRLIYNMVNNIEDARDLYQEVFIRVFKAINKFRFQSEFYTWIYRITVNTCINFRHRNNKSQFASFDDLVQKDDNNWKLLCLKIDEDPESELLNLELASEIRASLNRLSTRQRAVFVLKHYHGYKLKEIAEILNCSEGTIKNYMFRAVQKLKTDLSKYYQN